MELSRKFRFEASHIVHGKGQCSKLHGHSWELEVTLLGHPNAGTGITREDPNYLKHLVMPIIQPLNGSHLNFYINNPTVENVCLFFAHRLNAVESISECRVTVPSLFSSVWRASNKDDELFDTEKYPSSGYVALFNHIPAFASLQARAKWVADMKRKLKECYRNMTTYGAQLATFEQYQASLNHDEAEKLFEALTHAEKEGE